MIFLGRKILGASHRRKILDKTPFLAIYGHFDHSLADPPEPYLRDKLTAPMYNANAACETQTQAWLRSADLAPLPCTQSDITTPQPQAHLCRVVVGRNKCWSLYYYYVSACKVNTVNKLINTLWLRWSEVGIVGNWKLRFISVLLIIPKPKQSINISKVKL